MLSSSSLDLLLCNGPSHIGVKNAQKETRETLGSLWILSPFVCTRAFMELTMYQCTLLNNPNGYVRFPVILTNQLNKCM